MSNHNDSLPTTASVDRACRDAIVGKRAVQTIARWARTIQLNEAEFRLLWTLTRAGQGGERPTAKEAADQITLASTLAVSPAQMSACVATLSQRRLIALRRCDGDRRRQLCQATDAGYKLIQQTLQPQAPTTRIARTTGEAA